MSWLHDSETRDRADKHRQKQTSRHAQRHDKQKHITRTRRDTRQNTHAHTGRYVHLELEASLALDRVHVECRHVDVIVHANINEVGQDVVCVEHNIVDRPVVAHAAALHLGQLDPLELLRNT